MSVESVTVDSYGLNSMGPLCLWQCFVPLLVCVPVSVFSCIFEPFRCDRQGSEPERCRCVRDCTWCQSSSHLITCNAQEKLQCAGGGAEGAPACETAVMRPSVYRIICAATARLPFCCIIISPDRIFHLLPTNLVICGVTFSQ